MLQCLQDRYGPFQRQCILSEPFQLVSKSLPCHRNKKWIRIFNILFSPRPGGLSEYTLKGCFFKHGKVKEVQRHLDFIPMHMDGWILQLLFFVQSVKCAWADAADGDFRPFLWLDSKSTEDANTMVLRHWLRWCPRFRAVIFFDAWRIRPGLKIPIQLLARLTAIDLRHDEEMPEPETQNTRHVDRLIRRQEVLTQSDATTVADCAMEISCVMQLSQALLEAGDIIPSVKQIVSCIS